jgi:glycyl-tRNA synthetase (class II)
MIKNYGDVAVAWGYGPIGDEISNIIIKNKALRLVEKTEKMEDIEIYNRVFNSISTSEKEGNSSKETVINFNLKK